LLNSLSNNISFQHFNDILIPWIIILFNLSFDQPENSAVNISRPISLIKIYLLSTLGILTKSCIMLHTVTRTVNMDRYMTDILCWIR